ncbi:MAG: hypothetical protein QOE63_267, partial [Acidimicrobiaceae bacterium]
MTDRLDRDRLIGDALVAAGPAGDVSNLGDDTWQEGLDRLLDSFRTEARLSEVGLEI